MSFDETVNANGEFSTIFNWQTGCDVYDFTERTEFQIQILMNDVDQCDFGDPDTLSLDLKVLLPDNTDPVISSDLAQNSFIHPLNKPLEFNVRGIDTDGDELELKVVGDGFELLDYAILFDDVAGVSEVESKFTWFPSCENISFPSDTTNKKLRLWFVLNDLDKCKFPNYDSLEVNVTLIPPLNTAPNISINNRNEQVKVERDSVYLTVGDLVDVEVLVSDFEVNNVNLFLSDSSVIPDGLEFTSTSGIGNTKSEIKWLVECYNLDEGNKPRAYSLILVSTDDACYNQLENRRVLTLIVSDVESDDINFVPPNVFTPNNDGVNDTYSLENLPFDNCSGEFRSFRVHNRWGTEVYISIERDFVWNGEDLLPGVYFYSIEYTNKDYNGTISILN